jgi:hypothetical protein
MLGSGNKWALTMGMKKGKKKNRKAFNEFMISINIQEEKEKEHDNVFKVGAVVAEQSISYNSYIG